MIATALLVLALGFAGAPDSMVSVRVGEVTAVAEPRQIDLAVNLAEIAAQPALYPGLGRRSVAPLKLMVVPNAERLAQLSRGRAPTWGAAVVLPEQRLIVLLADGVDLPAVLRHELAHLALHDAVRTRVPLWFDEGYAARAAGEWNRLDALGLNLAVIRGDLPDLDGLNLALRGSASSADAAYALAVTAVLEIERRHPQRSLEPLLLRLAQAEPFPEALLASTGLTPDRFAEAWRRSVRRRYGWLTWLALGGGWSLVAAMVLLAGRSRRHLDDARRAALDIGWELPPEEADPNPA